MKQLNLIVIRHRNVSLESRKPFRTTEAMNNGDRTERNKIGEQGGLLSRDNNTGPVVALQSDGLEKRFVQGLRARNVEHVLQAQLARNFYRHL